MEKRKSTTLKRYAQSAILGKVMQTKFIKSYQFIKSTREMREPGEKTMIRLPEECKEYLAIYTTENDDYYFLETVITDDIILLRQAALD